jgi:hypothetical protein
VGCWCPWSPNPEDLEDQEYAETQLNTLMKKYKENAQLKDNFFEQRKQEKIEKSLAAKDAWTQRQEALKAEQEATASTSTSSDAVPNITIDDAPMDESS